MSTTEASVAGAVETWTIDPSHSLAEFSVRHMMITTVKGRFGELEGTVEATGEGEAWAVDVRIPAASIDTRSEQRDQHLRSADFFDAETHPYLTFRSRRVEGAVREAGDRFRIVGELTIRGTTREVTLDAEYAGEGQDPWGGQRRSFTATTAIDRRDYGLSWNQALETGGILVGDQVKITLEIQLVKSA